MNQKRCWQQNHRSSISLAYGPGLHATEGPARKHWQYHSPRKSNNHVGKISNTAPPPAPHPRTYTRVHELKKNLPWAAPRPVRRRQSPATAPRLAAPANAPMPLYAGPCIPWHGLPRPQALPMPAPALVFSDGCLFELRLILSDNNRRLPDRLLAAHLRRYRLTWLCK
jgi:hypothetical protein